MSSRPNLRIQFDFYHAQIVGGDLIRRFEKYFPYVGHVQIAAVPSRHEPDEGEVNYTEIFAELDGLATPNGSAANTGRAENRRWLGLGASLRDKPAQQLITSWRKHMRLDNKAALITGGASGFGKAHRRDSSRARARASPSPISMSPLRERQQPDQQHGDRDAL